MNILRISFALFLLLDSLGNVPIFASLLRSYSPKRQRQIIFRELFIALAIIVAFYFVGDFLLDLIQIDCHTLLIAGGIILFIIALQMIFGKDTSADAFKTPKVEPFIVPLAVPLTAGPAVLAAITLYAREKRSAVEVLLALFIAWCASTLILLFSSFLQRILGDKGLSALARLMGLILVLIAIQMLLQGLTAFIAHVR